MPLSCFSFSWWHVIPFTEWIKQSISKCEGRTKRERKRGNYFNHFLLFLFIFIGRKLKEALHATCNTAADSRNEIDDRMQKVHFPCSSFPCRNKWEGKNDEQEKLLLVQHCCSLPACLYCTGEILKDVEHVTWHAIKQTSAAKKCTSPVSHYSTHSIV